MIAKPQRQQIAVPERNISREKIARTVRFSKGLWHLAALSAIIQRFRSENMRQFKFYSRLSESIANVKNTKKCLLPRNFVSNTPWMDFCELSIFRKSNEAQFNEETHSRIEIYHPAQPNYFQLSFYSPFNLMVMLMGDVNTVLRVKIVWKK